MLTHGILALVATTTLAAPHTSNSANTTSDKKAYSLTTSFKGNTFFDNFSFFTGQDPTNGFVNYTSRETAATSGLVGFVHNLTSEADTAYIGVDYNTTTTVARNSVRLISDQKLNAGSMAVIDVRHIPVQNGVWPAIWMLGADGIWPASGESDILEYVHTAEANAVTLHTAPNFFVDNSTEAFQGSLVDSDCNAVNATKGCSITMEHNTSPDNTLATAGEAFNAQGGGFYVHDWTSEGITVWLFPRDDLPADLVAGKPDSSTWTRKPLAKFTGKGDFGTMFKNMQLIINIDFCGDWAGKAEVWTSSGAAKATGQETCEEYVGQNPSDFKQAYFEIGGVDFYSNAAGDAVPAGYQPEKRALGGHAHHHHHHHHHHHSLSHGHATSTDYTSQVQTSSEVPAKRSASTSDASATEVFGWLVAAGMFCAVAAFV